MPIPSSVMMALVAGGTLNSSAANFRTAVNGVVSGTLRLNKYEKLLGDGIPCGRSSSSAVALLTL